MVSIDSDGIGFECSFDLDELPILPTTGEVVAEGEAVYEGEMPAGEVPEGVVGVTGVIEMGEAVELTPEMMAELGIDPENAGPVEMADAIEVELGVADLELGDIEAGELGELEASGIAVAAPIGEGSFFEIGPDGEIVETEVTEGTPEQCDALREEWGS
jgi:hypothetical protein